MRNAMRIASRHVAGEPHGLAVRHSLRVVSLLTDRRGRLMLRMSPATAE